MFNNKRCIIGKAVFVILFILVMAFGVLFFKIYEQTKSNKMLDDIRAQKYTIEGHEILISYLRRIDNQGNKKSFYISNYYDRDYIKSLKEDMEKYFSNKLSNFPAWHINVIDSNENVIFYIQSESYYLQEYKLIQSDPIFIPVNGAKADYVKLILFLGVE